MKKKLNILLILFLLFSTSCQGQKQEINAVKASFYNYKTAILNDKGEDAAKFVDSRTIKYYSDILEKIKHADSLTVEGLSLWDKIMVFSIRHRTKKEEILSFDGKGLFVDAIKKGMVDKNSIANNTIGDVTINGDFAEGQFFVNGEKAPFNFHFYKENDEWKINLTSAFSFTTMALKKMVKDSGDSENEYIFLLLEMLTDKEPGNEIWVPTGK